MLRSIRARPVRAMRWGYVQVFRDAYRLRGQTNLNVTEVQNMRRRWVREWWQEGSVYVARNADGVGVM